MKKKIINILKKNSLLYKIYYYIGTLIVNIIKLFIKTDNKLILFVSYGGKQYSDSPKVIYEAMCQDPRFKNFDFVWAFQNPSAFDVPGRAKVIKIDTLKYFIISLKARCWITNVVVERTLNYSGKNTFYFCTWHGTPIKTLGSDIKIKTFYNHFRYKFDILLAQGPYDVEIFKRAFKLTEENIKLFGLPRNDFLMLATDKEQMKIKVKLGIPREKKVILYAPTYRDNHGYVMDKVLNFKKWYEILGDDYVILFRAHSAVNKLININLNFDFIYDVTNYPDLNELMIVSDMLISDYSSIFFDYSILGKPMFCYAYDYEEYNASRGLYFDIRKELLGGSLSEDELLYLIKNIDTKEAIEKTVRFRDKFISEYGNATRKSIDFIYKKLTE